MLRSLSGAQGKAARRLQPEQGVRGSSSPPRDPHHNLAKQLKWWRDWLQFRREGIAGDWVRLVVEWRLSHNIFGDNGKQFLFPGFSHPLENGEGKRRGQNQAGTKSTSDLDSGKGFLLIFNFFFLNCNKVYIKEQLNLFSGGEPNAVVKEAGWNLGSSTARDPPALLTLAVKVSPFRCVVRDTHHGVCVWSFKRVLVPGNNPFINITYKERKSHSLLTELSSNKKYKSRLGGKAS